MNFDRNSMAFGKHLDTPTQEVKKLPLINSNLCPEIIQHCECLNKHDPETFSLEMIDKLTFHVSHISPEKNTYVVTGLEGLVCNKCRRISVLSGSIGDLIKPSLVRTCKSIEELRYRLENITIVDKDHKVSYDPRQLVIYGMSKATRIPEIETMVIERPSLPAYKPYTNKLLSIAGHWRKVHVISTLSTDVFDITPDTAETVLSIFDNCFKVTNAKAFNEYVRPLDIRDADGHRYRLFCDSGLTEFSLKSKETRDRMIPFVTLKLRKLM